MRAFEIEEFHDGLHTQRCRTFKGKSQARKESWQNSNLSSDKHKLPEYQSDDSLNPVKRWERLPLMPLGKTFETALAEANFRPSGFDYMRLILAMSILIGHTVEINNGWQAQLAVLRSPWEAYEGLMLPMFFALSGFLVTGSLERSKTLVTFLGLRAFRIVPALAVDVLLAALILGPVVTSYHLKDYFTDPKFYSYFLNILGDIHFELPGVFLNNPDPKYVNGQLWTIPFELKCYIALAALSVFGIVKKRNLLLWLMAGGVLYQIGHLLLKPEYLPDQMRGYSLVITFISGVTAYKFKDKIPYNGWLCAFCLLLTMASFLYIGLNRLTIIPATYATIYLGLLTPPAKNLS